MSNTAATLPAARSKLSLTTRPIPDPKPHQILVKNHAVATNAIDWKIQTYGFMIEKFPCVLGSDISGTVEAVGQDITHFKQGDRVTGFAGMLASQEIDEGAFQEYTLINEHCAAKIPESMSYEEGATLPMAVATAGMAIFNNLEVPRSTTPNMSGGFLVWGAASSIGTGAVQLARQLGFTVFATASPKHHDYLKSIGAAAVVDYRDTNAVEALAELARGKDLQIKHGFDAISEGGSAQLCAKALDIFGGGKLCLALPWPTDVEKPTNVAISSMAAFRIAKNLDGFGTFLFNEWLEEALVKKTYVSSPEIQIVEGGLASMQKALDTHKAGVSGKKLVVKI